MKTLSTERSRAGVNGKQAAQTSRTKVLCNGERIYVLSRNENTHTQMIIWIM